MDKHDDKVIEGSILRLHCIFLYNSTSQFSFLYSGFYKWCICYHSPIIMQCDLGSISSVISKRPSLIETNELFLPAFHIKSPCIAYRNLRKLSRLIFIKLFRTIISFGLIIAQVESIGVIEFLAPVLHFHLYGGSEFHQKMNFSHKNNSILRLGNVKVLQTKCSA